MDFASIYGPLDKKSCIYFLVITIFAFITLVTTFVFEMVYVFKNYKNLNIANIARGVLILFNIFIAYFLNRLFYNMCSKSLA